MEIKANSLHYLVLNMRADGAYYSADGLQKVLNDAHDEGYQLACYAGAFLILERMPDPQAMLGVDMAKGDDRAAMIQADKISPEFTPIKGRPFPAPQNHKGGRR